MLPLSNQFYATLLRVIYDYSWPSDSIMCVAFPFTKKEGTMYIHFLSVSSLQKQIKIPCKRMSINNV